MEKYNIIIVGSGLGGLECGAILSREGYKVLVLEKNKQIGGNLQVFSRDKRIFDTGIHYIGGLDKGENLYRYFKFLGIIDDLKLHRLDKDGFDVVSFDGDPKEYKYGQGYKNFIEILIKDFPEEREGINRYCEKIKEICSSFPLYQVRKSENVIDKIQFLEINARDFIASCTSNKKLQKVLGGTNPLYAGEGDKTPFYVHALVVNSYIESAWRCIDGGSQIARLLSRIIHNNKGKVLKHSEVKKFVFKDHLISHVEITNGKTFYGDKFISNLHPALTLDMLEKGHLRKAYTKRIKSLSNSTSIFIVYLVLKKKSVPYHNCNYYHYIDNNVWEGSNYKEKWPPSYALFTGITSKEKKFADTMIVMAYMRYEETQKWQDSFNTVSKESDRGKEYEAFKKEKAEKLIDEVEMKFPGIRENIESYYTSTPLTYRDYTNTPDGSIYGISKDSKEPLRTFISPKTKVPNLLLTGQNLNMHGVLGVTISAVQTCSEILGHHYLMDKIIKDSEK